MNVIGIDPSTSATGLTLPVGMSYTLSAKAGPENVAQRLSELDTRLRGLLRYVDADVAMIELVPMHGVQPLTKIRLAELGGVFRLALFEFGIPFVEVNPMSLKKYATGKGTAQKDEMVRAARNLGYVVNNDNEADAALLQRIGRDFYDGDWQKLERHQIDLLEKLNFPKI